AHEMTCARLSLVVIDDATPEQMPDVGGQRIDFAFLAIKCEGKELLFRNPKILVEFTFEFSSLFLQSSGSLRIVPEFAGQSRTTALCIKDVSLNLTGCDRRVCQRSVGKGDGVP